MTVIGAYWRLLGHELRLWGRHFRHPRRALFIVALVFAAAHGLVSPLAHGEGRMATLAASLPTLVGIGGLLGALRLTVDTVAERGDVDLLAAAPVPPAAILAARGTVIALSSVAFSGLFVIPYGDVMIVRDGPGWFGTYALVAGLGLIATGVALVVVVVAAHLLGARRIRTALYFFSGLIALGVVLAMPMMTATDGGRAIMASINGSWPFALARAVVSGAFVLPFLAVAILVFVAAVTLCGPGWLSIALTPPLSGRTAVGGVVRPFATASLTWTVLSHETRRLLRAPDLWLRLIRVMVNPAVLAGICLPHRIGPGDGVSAVWLVTVLMAGVFAGILMEMVVVSEPWPDLLATAPVARRQLILAKCAVALAPSLALVAAAGVFASPAAVWLVTGGLGAALSVAAINGMYRGRTVARRFGERRRDQIVLDLVETAIGFGWSGVAGIGVAKPVAGIVPAAVLFILVLFVLGLGPLGGWLGAHLRRPPASPAGAQVP